MRLGIGGKSAVAFSVLVVLSTTLVGAMVYTGSRQFLIRASQEHLAHDTEVVARRLRDVVAGIGTTVQRLADRSVAPIVGGAGPDGGASGADAARTPGRESGAREQLAAVFDVLLATQPDYHWLSYAAAAGGGREVVRVERRDQDLVEVEGEAEGNYLEEHFGQLLRMPAGQVFLSGFLSHEGEQGEAHGQEEHGGADAREPSRRAPGPDGSIPGTGHGHEAHGGVALVAASPVRGPSGAPAGVVALEVDFGRVFDGLASLVDPTTSLYVVNEAGQCLFHPEHATAAADDPCERAGVLAEFPRVAPLLEGRADHLLLEAADPGTGDPVVADFRRVPIGPADGGRFVVVGSVAPHSVVLAGATAVRDRSLLAIAALAAGATLLALLLSRALTRPLEQVTAAVSRFGTGAWDRRLLPAGRRDEIGLLAATVGDMAAKIDGQLHELAEKEERLREAKEAAETAKP